jgi:hypothetical protein
VRPVGAAARGITENRETVASQPCNASVCVSRVVRANCKIRGVSNILNFDLLNGSRIDGSSQHRSANLDSEAYRIIGSRCSDAHALSLEYATVNRIGVTTRDPR